MKVKIFQFSPWCRTAPPDSDADLGRIVPGGRNCTTLEAGNSVMWNRGCCHNRVVTSRFKILLPLVKVSENENRWKSGWWSSPRLARQIVHEGKDNRALLQLDLWIKIWDSKSRSLIQEVRFQVRLQNSHTRSRSIGLANILHTVSSRSVS